MPGKKSYRQGRWSDADIHASYSSERGAGQAPNGIDHKEVVLKAPRKKNVLKALLQENFSNWTKRDMKRLIRAYEQSDHTDIKTIAKANLRF